MTPPPDTNSDRLPDPTAQLTRLQVVDIQPGDLIIGTLPEGCPAELAIAIGDDLTRRFPDNPTLLLPAGVGLHVHRHTPAQNDQGGDVQHAWPMDNPTDPSVYGRGLWAGYTASDGTPLDEDDAAFVRQFAEELRSHGLAHRAADALRRNLPPGYVVVGDQAPYGAPIDPHRPPGYVTATGPDDANELYLRGHQAAPVCESRCRFSDDLPVHVCCKPAGHTDEDCRCLCGDGWPNLRHPDGSPDAG